MKKRVVGLGILLVVLLAGGIAVALSADVPADHSAYRESPSDLRSFREELLAAGYEVDSIAGSPLAIVDSVDPDRTLIVVAGVERPWNDAEIAALDGFVRGGGRLLVADDTGNANPLGLRMGVSFSAIPVVDEDFLTNVSLVNVNATIPRRAGEAKVYSPVVMNIPTSLSADDGVNATIIASTTEASFGDLGRNGVRDAGDLKGPFAVAIDVKVGRGRAVFVSDADFLTSALQGDRARKNAAFAQDLVLSLLPDGGSVLFEESRHGAPPLETAAARGLAVVVAATRDPVIRWVSLAVAAAAGVALVALVPGEESLGHHTARLDTASPVRLDDAGDRLRRAAKAKIRIVHGARPEDDPARLSTDPVLAKLAGSENPISPDKDWRDIVQRVRSYGTTRTSGRGPP